MRGHGHADRQREPLPVRDRGTDVPGRLVEQVPDPAGVDPKPPARLRQLHAAGRAEEELGSERPLDLEDPGRDRRLRQVEVPDAGRTPPASATSRKVASMAGLSAERSVGVMAGGYQEG